MTKNKTIVLNEGIIDYSPDFKELYHILTRLSSLSKKEVPLVIEQISKNHFFNEINQPKTKFNIPSGFYDTKEMMIQKNLIRPREYIPITIEDLVDKYWLDFMCATIINCFIDDEGKLEKVVSRKKRHRKRRNAMNMLNNEWRSSGSVLFETCVIEHLFYATLDALLQSDKENNIYLTGKSHSDLARELMTKKTLELLYLKFLTPSKTDRLPANVSDQFILDSANRIIFYFFNSTAQTNLKQLALKIKAKTIQNIKNLKIIKDMTALELIKTPLAGLVNC